MKKFFNQARSRMITGFVFLIPLFALILLLQKFWTALRGAGDYVVNLFGLSSLLGSNSVTIATAVVIIVLFYLFGWMVKFQAMNRIRDMIENKLLKYIPGYENYKNQLAEKVNPKEDTRIPVWVATKEGKRPGLLVTENADEAIVFFPNAPDPRNGGLLVVTQQQISKLNMKAAGFLECMKTFGKDLFAITVEHKQLV